MAAHEISKEIQSGSPGSYLFGEFELNPAERLLTRNRNSIALPPKSFDALLFFLRRAEHLVRKNELIEFLWPSTFVTEANLTNIVAGLRKVLGHDAIQTVSRHGYRFMLPVRGEPGIGRQSYDSFAQARELIRERSLESLTRARDLLWICLAGTPDFATGWAWLGRCCWMIAKFGGSSAAAVDLAEAFFRRTFAIEPDLACAHQFYTPVQADTGHAAQALTRLRERIARNPAEPESFTGLVQILRFRGLLDESLAAHGRAVDLDPAVSTSVAHTLFLKGDYASAIESYGGRAGYYLDAAAWAALGNTDHAQRLLRDRLARPPLSALMSGLMSSLLAIVETKSEPAISVMRSMEITREPEALVYLARHYSHLGESGIALDILNQAAQQGFVCAPAALRSDPWLASVRLHAGFPAFLREAETLTASASDPQLSFLRRPVFTT